MSDQTLSIPRELCPRTPECLSAFRWNGCPKSPECAGIADYFSPTIPISRISGGGAGLFGGDDIRSENVLAQNGSGASNRFSSEQRQARGNTGVSITGQPSRIRAMQGDAFAKIQEQLATFETVNPALARLLHHVTTRMTDEGFVIELFDLPDAPLFQTETAMPSDILNQLAPILVSVVNQVTNRIALAGHTQARPVTLVHDPAWDLSMSRAGLLRVMLTGDGLEPDRIRRVTGHADRDPVTSDPMSLRNNRLEVILLLADRN